MGACGLESSDVVLAAIPIRKMTIGIAQTLLLDIEWRIAMPKRTTGDRPELKTVSVGAAAIDIGSKMHMAAVNPACTDVPVRSFGTFTQHLHDLADWFKACGVTSVAMESTGIYWIPVYEILEQRGFDVILVPRASSARPPDRQSRRLGLLRWLLMRPRGWRNDKPRHSDLPCHPFLRTSSDSAHRVAFIEGNRVKAKRK